MDVRLSTIDMGRKLGDCAYFLWGEGAGSPCNTMWPGPRPTFVPSGILIHQAVWPQQTWAENWGLCPLGMELGPHLTQCCPGRGLPSYQVAPSSIQLFGHHSHGPKISGRGLCPFLGREVGAHLAQCGRGRGLPPYQVASCSIQLF